LDCLASKEERKEMDRIAMAKKEKREKKERKKKEEQQR